MNKFTISALAALTIAGTALGMSGATATTQTTVKASPSSAYVAKPSKIIIGDSNWYVSNLKWSNWSIDHAKATGVEYQKDCEGTCPSLPYHKRNVSVLLDDNVGGHFYSLTVIYSQSKVDI